MGKDFKTVQSVTRNSYVLVAAIAAFAAPATYGNVFGQLLVGDQRNFQALAVVGVTFDLEGF